jgi:hypothetical protein
MATRMLLTRFAMMSHVTKEANLKLCSIGIIQKIIIKACFMLYFLS